MKKLGVVLASALAAGLFFGCSNDSDDNNMGLLLAVAGSNGGNSSITANLPKNVGTNELAGKSFQYNTPYSMSNKTISFDNNFVTFTTSILYPEDQENGTKTYIESTTYRLPYSYNAQTKNLYYSKVSSVGTIYSDANNVRFPEPSMTFSTEDEYSAKKEDFYKKLNVFTDAALNKKINEELKNIRKTVYSLSLQCDLPTAYTDENYQTPLTPDQISFYNKYGTMLEKANKRTIECHAYELENGNLKLYDSGNLPAGIKFGGIYNGTYDFSTEIEGIGGAYSVGDININVFEIIDPNNSLGAKIFTPSITVDGLSLKVASASDDSVTCILKLLDSTSKKITLKLENKTTAKKTTVTVKMPQFNLQGEVVGYEEHGTFEIPYNNIPVSYTTYTQCE